MTIASGLAGCAHLLAVVVPQAASGAPGIVVFEATNEGIGNRRGLTVDPYADRAEAYDGRISDQGESTLAAFRQPIRPALGQIPSRGAR